MEKITKILTPIAYYNNLSDLLHLENKSADEIVEYMLNGNGDIIKASDDYCVACYEDDTTFQFTTDRKYAVDFDFNSGGLMYGEYDIIMIYKVR